MIRINLLPVRAEKRKQTLRKHIVVVGAYLACLILVLLSVTIALNGKITSLEGRIAQQKKDIARLDKIIKEVEDYEEKLKDLAQKIEVIQALKLRQRGPARPFHELAQLIPEKLWIEKLSESGGKMVIEGYAIDNQTLATFMTKLEQSPQFQKVRLSVSKQAEKGGVVLKAFTMDVQVVTPGRAATGAPMPNQPQRKG